MAHRIFLSIFILILYTLSLVLANSINATKPIENKIIKPSSTSKKSITTTLDSNQYGIKKTIVNPHDFNYILNPGYDICGANKSSVNPVFLFVYVHTSPSNFMRRISIRETWANRALFRDMRLVFMMGKTLETKTNEMLKLESNVYNDIVQEDFHDSYKNLTYKGIMAMKWISEYCNHTQYILKVDDDIVSNIFIVLRHLKSLQKSKINQEKSVMCLVWDGMVVQREKKNKWYVPKELYGPDRFSQYCSGSAYLFTGDMPAEMYKKSLYLKFMWVDDFYITGLLADAVNATHRNWNSLYIINSGLVETTFLNKKSDRVAFGHIPKKINKMYSVWKFVFETQLAHFPSLKTHKAMLLEKNDFTYIDNFHWSMDIWKPYLEDEIKLNKSVFEYESF